MSCLIAIEIQHPKHFPVHTNYEHTENVPPIFAYRMHTHALEQSEEWFALAQNNKILRRYTHSIFLT